MRLRCTSCNFELNLPIKTLPQNTRLFCPKCKSNLAPLSDDQNNAAMPLNSNGRLSTSSVAYNNQKPETAVSPQSGLPSITTISQSEVQNSPPSVEIPPPQMFSEDLKPELEVENNREDIYVKREGLFEKPSQVWYDGAIRPPPINIVPPPPSVTPPPIPTDLPPPIPDNSNAPTSGYISASSSIQIDSSLIVSGDTHSPQISVEQQAVIREEKIELDFNSTQPSVQADLSPSPPLDILSNNETPQTEKKDVIILTGQPYTYKKISITLPVIGLILLAIIAGVIYYQIVVSSSKLDMIQELKSRPPLGAIPAINSKVSEDPTSTRSNRKEETSPSNTKNPRVPIKAKRSALEHYKRGNRFFMESKYEQARDEYSMAISADPDFGLAYRGLGTAYAKLGQPDLAVKNYEKYIELNPNATDAEQVKGIIKQYYGK